MGAVLGFIALAMTATALPASGELLDARSELSVDDVARFELRWIQGSRRSPFSSRRNGRSEQAIWPSWAER